MPARAATLCACAILTLLVSAPFTSGQQSPDTAVQGLMQRYSSALESLDAEAVKKVQPSIDVARLRKAFGDMRTLEVHIDAIKVLSASGDTARVSCRVTQALTPRAGAKQTSTVLRVMQLRKQDATWVIDAFER